MEPRLITRDNAAWPAMKAWLLDEIAKLHIQLERTDLQEPKHNLTRGTINAYRGIIKTVEPKAVGEASRSTYVP